LNNEDKKKKYRLHEPNVINLGGLGCEEQLEKAVPNGFSST
jgi:hypothetical protein